MEQKITPHFHNDIDGWMDIDVEALYREVVASLPNGGTLVEVGCWKGKSLCYLLVEAKNSGKYFNIYGVDHFQGSVGEDKLIKEAQNQDIRDQCIQNCSRAYPLLSYQHIELICLPSIFAADGFWDATVDFVFLDASHDYDSVKADIQAWLPKIKPGGLLAGHDAGSPGVACAVAGLLPDAVSEGSIWRYKVKG